MTDLHLVALGFVLGASLGVLVTALFFLSRR